MHTTEISKLHIINYPHPTLRHKSKPIRRVDAELKKVVRQMFELMYEANGVGLAANQVDLPLRLFVVNLEADPEKGDELVFINPVLSMAKGSEEAEEGCLSLPGLYGQVTRPERIKVTSYSINGEEFVAELDGLFARVVQHETDHLDGVLFTDRMSETGRIQVQPEVEKFEREFAYDREHGRIPSDEQIVKRLSEQEEKYC